MRLSAEICGGFLLAVFIIAWCYEHARSDYLESELEEATLRKQPRDALGRWTSRKTETR